MKKFLNVPALTLTIVMTVILEVLMNQKNVDLTTKIIGGLIFLVLNYTALAGLSAALKRLFRILMLPGVKLRSYAYYLYPVALLVVYAGFLAVMARLAAYYLPQLWLAGLIAAGVILVILAQLGGSFPDSRISPRKKALRLENAGGSLGGFEILGSLIGQYKDGIVLGVNAIPYSKIDRIHRSKDSIIIEGAGEPKLELIIVSERAQEYFIDLLAERLGTTRSLLASSLTDKQKDGFHKTKDLLKTQQSANKVKDLKRAKPVKLIEAQNQAKTKTGAAKAKVTQVPPGNSRNNQGTKSSNNI